MPLILSLKVEDQFYVEDEQFTLVEIISEHEFVISATLADAKPQTWTITDEHGREVMPDVFIAAGDMHQTNVASVVITAPRDIVILRGDLYHAGLPQKEKV